MKMKKYIEPAIRLLEELIETPSFSREEGVAAELVESFFSANGITSNRLGNNIWVQMPFQENKPTLLLNSHIDTVKPASTWTKDPFKAVQDGDFLFGLGSNDAGASLVSLIATFCYFFENEKNLPFNLIFAASCEEEISGKNGITALLPELGHIDLAIVGEPTQMRMAVAEKGLMVVDAKAIGKSGHAAREEGENAIYIAQEDVNWIRNKKFEKQSEFLGPVKMTVTQIEAGTQHNVVPDECKFVIDIRTIEHYPNKVVFEILQTNLKSKLTARSFRLNPSGITLDHPLVIAAQKMKIPLYGSPTLSDQALMPFSSIKMGPGKSERSHTADEFIKILEIENAIPTYINLLKNLTEIPRHRDTVIP